MEMLSVEITSRHLNWRISRLKLLLTSYSTYLINANNFFLQGVPVVNEKSPNMPPRKVNLPEMPGMACEPLPVRLVLVG
jgi:hypothetical protein